MRTSMRLAVLSVALVVAPLAACGDDDDGDEAMASTTTTSTGATSSTTEAAPSSSTTTGAASPSTTGGGTATEEPDSPTGGGDTGRSELEDGRHFGYWRTFEIGDTIAFGELDLAFFLTGAEAEAAAAERGDEVDNDYFIVNDSSRLRTLIVGGDAEVRVLDGGEPDLHPSNVADFAVERAEDAGFWVTVEDGIVTSIEQQFVP